MKADFMYRLFIRTGSGRACWVAAGILFAAMVPVGGQSGPATVINSETLEMRGTEQRNFFYFQGTVHVRGEDVEIHCDELEVVSAREGDADATIGEIGAIERIVATGAVRIHQAGREARAGKAVMNPREGSVVLSEDPRIIDGETEVTGWQIVLARDRSIRVLQDPEDPAPGSERRRATVILGGQLPDLRFDRAEDAFAEGAEGDRFDSSLPPDTEDSEAKEGADSPDR